MSTDFFSSTSSLEEAHLLEQLTDEQFWQYAHQLAHLTPESRRQQDEYLLCRLSYGACMLPLPLLGEVSPIPLRHTLLPTTPPWMLGLSTWHGETLALIDVGAYLMGETAHSAGAAQGVQVIVHSEELTVALRVVAVERTLHVEEERIHIPTQDSLWYPSLKSGLVKGVYEGEEEIAVLDISSILMDLVLHIGMLSFHE